MEYILTELFILDFNPLSIFVCPKLNLLVFKYDYSHVHSYFHAIMLSDSISSLKETGEKNQAKKERIHLNFHESKDALGVYGSKGIC